MSGRGFTCVASLYWLSILSTDHGACPRRLGPPGSFSAKKGSYRLDCSRTPRNAIFCHICLPACPAQLAILGESLPGAGQKTWTLGRLHPPRCALAARSAFPATNKGRKLALFGPIPRVGIGAKRAIFLFFYKLSPRPMGPRDFRCAYVHFIN